MGGVILNFKKMIWLFIILIIILSLPIFNLVTNPFDVLTNQETKWDTVFFTKESLQSKMSYLDDNYERFDSYLIGGSSTSMLPTAAFNEYMDASFGNIYLQGADMLDIEKIALYAIENFDPKNIVLNLSLLNAVEYNYQNDSLPILKIEKAQQFADYFSHLFANPKHGLSKIIKNQNFQDELAGEGKAPGFEINSDIQLRQDVESIQDIKSYSAKYSFFDTNLFPKFSLNHLDDFIHSLERIKISCNENEIELIVVFQPTYYSFSSSFDPEQVQELYTKIAEFINFWDFSANSLTADPRFFYDEIHFRSSLGKMVLARVFADDSIYLPQDFGVYIRKETAQDQALSYSTEFELDDAGYTTKVSIIMYHNLSQINSETLEIEIGRFEEHIKALSVAGYNTVSMRQLVDYVEMGTELPENPIVITFDDGYFSNYKFAYPILKEYEMKATIFVIGSLVGKPNYWQPDNPIKQYFDYEEAKEMIDSGFIEIQSHSYDMHERPIYESAPLRNTVTKLESETDQDFVQAVQEDYLKSKEDIENNTNQEVFAFAYPLGEYSDLSEIALTNAGVKLTLSINPGLNVLVKGLPQSLLALKRTPVYAEFSGAKLVRRLEEQSK